MKTLLLLISGLLLQLIAHAQTDQRPPASPKKLVTDTYYGKPVTDHFRWLEDMDSPETKAWFQSQGEVLRMGKSS